MAFAREAGSSHREMEDSRRASGRSPWWIVLGSLLCLIVGNGPVMQFTFGVFLGPILAEFGSDRGTLSVALFAGLCLTGICTPLVGRLIDRFGIRRVTLPAIVVFAICIASLGWFVRSPMTFILLYGLLGIVSSGQAPLPYARAVALAFNARRGLALGIAMAGVGLGSALLPLLAQALITEYGWRVAYQLIGVLVFIIAFPSMALLVGRGEGEGPEGPQQLPGDTASTAARTHEFWILAIAFFFVAMAASGMMAHLIPLLGDRGITPKVAALTVSISGIALIAGRLIAGYLLDRLFAPRVAMIFFAAPMVGILILIGGGEIAWMLMAAVLVGLGLGAEVDLIAFLISRYFGMRSFGEIYGYLFAAFMIGGGAGPFAMGGAYTLFGSYTPALWAFVAALLAACLLVIQLGPYRFGVMDKQPAH